MANLLKNFDVGTVISATSPVVLQDYFHKKGLCLDIENFQRFKQQKKADEYNRCLTSHIMETPLGVQEILSDFEKVYILRKSQAFHPLSDSICHLYPQLMEEMDKLGLKRECDKLFYLLEKEPKHIHDFYRVLTLKEHPESHWSHRRSGIKKRDEDITLEEIEALKAEISAEVMAFTGGKNCKIQHILCEGKDHLFVIAEDRPTTISLWQEGEPENSLIHPTFDIAFVYDREEGTLDVCCTTDTGAKPLRNKMQLAFSKAVLGQEIQTLAKDEEIYDLPAVLKQLCENKRVDFSTENSEVIHDIFIRSMVLLGKFYHRGRITLDTQLTERINQYQDDIFTELERYLKLHEASSNTVSIEHMTISRIDCIVCYYDPIAKKDKKQRFSISGRSGCNLGFDGVDKEIRQCLTEAGIQAIGKEHEECLA